MIKLKKISVMAIAVAAMTISLSSCDFTGLSDAADDFKVVIGLEPINTTSAVLLTDAATGELISANVQASFEGENGDDVIDIYSDPMSEKEVSSGILTFGVSNETVPSEDNPVNVRLVLEADGYLTTSKTAALTTEGTNEFSFKMIKENNKPEGITTTSSTAGQSGADGAVEEEYVVEANSDDGDDAGVSISVAQGTVFRDANGNALTGQLTTEMSYFNPNKAGAMLAFPVELQDEDGNLVITAGASTISIRDANGNVAASSSAAPAKGVQGKAMVGGTSYTVSLPPGFINPNTNAAVAVGDVATAYIYDSNIFYLGIESTTITELAGGRLGANIESEKVPGLIHLSFKPLNSVRCGRAQLNLTRNGDEGSINMNVFGAGYGAEFVVPANTTNYTASINIFSKSFNYRLQASSGVVEGTHNFCDGPLDVSLPGFANANVIDATVNVSLSCQNSEESVSVTDIPGASVAYRKQSAVSGTPWKIATSLNWDFDEASNSLTGGSFNVQGVEQGEVYTFKIVYEGETFIRDVEITGTSVSYTEIIDSGICQ